jgi:tetratricopeptide (TPR) repeat protein
MAKQDYAAAEAEFVKQLEVNNKSSIVYTQIATARARQGNLEGAEQAFKQGLGELPDDARLLLGLAGLYNGQGKLDAAAGVYRQGMTAAPDNARFAMGLAVVRERQQRHDDAIALYEQLLEQNPDSILVINNLAAMLADHRQDEASLARAKELAAKLGNAAQPAFQDTVGWVHYRLGEYDEAARILSGLVEQMPDVPVFNYHLGMVYYRQGDNRAARELLARAVDEKATYHGVDEARRVLGEIE